MLFEGNIHSSYICWVLCSSTDSSSSFIWLLSSSSWELGSSESGWLLLPSGGPSETVAAATLGLGSVLAMGGLWNDGDWANVFEEGCQEKQGGHGD